MAEANYESVPYRILFVSSGVSRAISGVFVRPATLCDGDITFGGSGSDLAEEPVARDAEPVTLATSRSRLSSRIRYCFASTSSCRYTALLTCRLSERSASRLDLPSVTLRSK